MYHNVRNGDVHCAHLGKKTIPIEVGPREPYYNLQGGHDKAHLLRFHDDIAQ